MTVDGDGVADPREVVLRSAGFAFRPPAGWTARATPGGVLLGHATIPGVILVSGHGAGTVEEMRRVFTAGIAERGLRLAPAGAPEQLAQDALGGPVEGTADRSSLLGWAAMALAPEGGGATVLALTSPEGYGPAYRAVVMRVVESLRFLPPDQDLAAHFVGVWWHFEQHGVSSQRSASESTVAMRADGTFTTGREPGGSDEDGSSLGRSTSSGRWSVRGTLEQGELVLRYPDGTRTVVPYVVHREGGTAYEGREYYFDGVLYAKDAKP